jgi:RNA polymerase primary sigma factor
LSFADLEIPIRPLLTAAEERCAGRMIRSSLRRLSSFLPCHPRGFRRYLARMNEVVMGGGLMFSWLAVRERMAGDLEVATRALERAERLAKSKPSAAWKSFDAGAQILRTYPLDPETLYQWARDVVRSKAGECPLLELKRCAKVERVLKRLVERLERERDRLVLPNFRLVLKEVFRYHPTGMRRSDLFQEGVLGLHKAVFRFDPTRATRFSTYATYWIRQAIRKALIDKSRLIRVPQAVQEELRKEKSTLAKDEAERIRRLMTETMLFSGAENDDDGDRNSFVVEDLTTPELGESLHTQTIPQAVSAALEGLGSREREVLLRRFGLAGERPQTLEEIGSRMNLSRERIRQIEREALGRMRRSGRLREVYEDLGLVAVTNSPSHN